MAGRKRFFIIFGCLLVFLPLVIFAGESSKNYNYVATKFLINYHLPTCKKVKRIQEQNRVTFASPEEAIRVGYIACGLCNPTVKDSSTGKEIRNNP